MPEPLLTAHSPRDPRVDPKPGDKIYDPAIYTGAHRDYEYKPEHAEVRGAIGVGYSQGVEVVQRGVRVQMACLGLEREQEAASA